jgi:hypothetical protein
VGATRQAAGLKRQQVPTNHKAHLPLVTLQTCRKRIHLYTAVHAQVVENKSTNTCFKHVQMCKWQELIMLANFTSATLTASPVLFIISIYAATANARRGINPVPLRKIQKIFTRIAIMVTLRQEKATCSTNTHTTMLRATLRFDASVVLRRHPPMLHCSRNVAAATHRDRFQITPATGLKLSRMVSLDQLRKIASLATGAGSECYMDTSVRLDSFRGPSGVLN